MEISQQHKRIHYGYVIFAAMCLLQMVTTGILLQSIGIFVVPVSAAFEVSSGTFLLYVSFMFIVATLVLPQSNKLYERFGAKKLMFFTAIVNGLGIIGFGLSPNIVFFCAMGAVVGVSQAFALYLIPPVLINTWFSKNQNLYIGIVFAFGGVGGVVFNQLGGRIMAEGSWRLAYLVLGASALIIGLIAACMTVNTPKDKQLQPVGYGEASEDSATREAAAADLPGVEASAVLKSSAFVLVAVFAFMFNFSTGINPLLAGFASLVGGDASFGVTAATIGTVGATVAGFIIGAVNTKSTRAGVIVSAASGLVGMVLFLVDSGSMSLVYIATFLSVFSFTVVTAMVPALTTEAFGLKAFNDIYAKISTVTAIPPIFASVFWGYLLGLTSYPVVWVGGLIVFAIVLVSGIFAIVQGKKLW